ncbi:MAG: hypothetical protein GC159_04850 [Phycisphaera sp.]|nr:hypothetical protein [Phycisphaera sp.]
MKSAKLISVLAAVLVPSVIVAAFALYNTGPIVPTSPIASGEARVHVTFRGLSNDQFNQLVTRVQKLAEDHSALVEGSATERDVHDYNASLGFWNSGFVDQNYKPSHPTPSADTERAMRDELNAYLEDQHIKPGSVTLELQYGK